MLRDRSGQQLVNTRVPRGAPLPIVAGIAEVDGRATETGLPQVSNLFIGAVARVPLFAIEKAIRSGGEIRYFLMLSVPAEHVSGLINASRLPSGWWGTVVDGNGLVLARSLAPEGAIGGGIKVQAWEAINNAAPAYATTFTSPDGVRELSKVLDGMGKALASCDEMLTSISELSVLDSGKTDPKPASFPVDELLAEVAEEVAPLAAAAKLTFRRMPCSAVVFSDRALLKRMIRNLLVNAIRYTQAGGVVLGCRRRNGRLLVQVVDTGVGIPPAELTRIFDEFYQVGGKARDPERGLGLGLSIVSRLSQLLGNLVTVHSTPGRGSTFSIELATIGVAERPSPNA